jgi:hypothetical protein
MKKTQCVICKEGEYVDVKISDPTDLHNFGLGARFVGRTGWHASECDQCGNVQMFRYERSDQELHG